MYNIQNNTFKRLFYVLCDTKRKETWIDERNYHSPFLFSNRYMYISEKNIHVRNTFTNCFN